LIGTANSFLLAVPFTLLLIAFQRFNLHIDRPGVVYALISGAGTSAIGYVIWYWVRVRMTTISAAVLQISVPLLSAVFGILLLDENLAASSAISAIVIFIGLSLVMFVTKTRAD
jgi:drug/metabolite transporter (DMT)-like permease